MATRSDYVLPHVTGPRVLDVGCAVHEPEPGSPHWLHGELLKRFPDLVGIDVNQSNVEKLTSLGYENIHVQNAETFEVGTQFDTIVAGDVIEHMSNPGRFLDSARRHLAPGGRLIITTPYAFCLLAFVYATFKFPRTCENLEHTLFLCPQTFQELIKRAGLEVEYWRLFSVYSMDVPSSAYRAFVMFLRIAGRLVPERLRCNEMLFVLKAAA